MTTEREPTPEEKASLEFFGIADWYLELPHAMTEDETYSTADYPSRELSFPALVAEYRNGRVCPVPEAA
jgi:hypothetical protein